MLSLLFKMSILVFFENYVGVWSEQTKYLSTQIKFAIYRSLCCLFLFLYAVVNVFFVDKSAFLNLVYYNNPHIIDLNQWFLAYAIVDTIKTKTTTSIISLLFILYEFETKIMPNGKIKPNKILRYFDTI